MAGSSSRVIRGPRPVKVGPSANVWRIAAVVALGAFTGQLDTSVVNVGLNTLARDLGTGQPGDLVAAQWVSNGYLLALAASLPATGWLSRKFGPTRLWLITLTGFTVASGLCALAGDLSWLIVLRVLQGLFAGMVVPAGLTIIGRATGADQLGRVMASLGVVMALAPALGPTAGGLLLQFAGWPWLFWLNLPIGLAGVLLGMRYLPKGGPSDREAGQLDWFGLVLVSLGVPLVVYGCAEWSQHGTLADPIVTPTMGLGLLMLVSFGVYARRKSNPVLNLRLFAIPSYSAANSTVAFTSAAMYGAALLFPLYFQIGRGASPLSTGLLLISMSVGNMIALPFTGRLVDRYGGGPVCLWGCVGATVTTVPFALLDLHVGEVWVQALLVVRGLTLAAAMMPPITSAYLAVDPEKLPDATTQVNILMRVGGALGGALLAAVLTSALPTGAQPAFQASFWWLTGASALGAATAVWLTVTERRRATEHHTQG
jgi:EmrB/QacA subfamily drug resistance transporter